MSEPSDADWSARRRDAATEHAARLDRARSAESDQARALLAGFVRDARARGLPTVALRARAHNGRTLYRTGLTGWYLKRNGSVAVDDEGRFYLMSAPTSAAARLRGTRLVPSDPPLVVGLGGRDGESMPLADLLAVRLASEETWDR
jgi:hypothetical protein